MTLYQKIRILFTLHTKTRNKIRENFIKKNYKKSQMRLSNKLNLEQYDYKPLPFSVLIIEPNPYHGEIQPGFVKYFQDLGYNVDIFMRLENYLENPFVRYKNNPPRRFYGTAETIRQWVNNLRGNEYEYIFFSSSAFWNSPQEFRGKYLDFLGEIPKSKHGILMVEHNAVPYLEEYDEETYLKQNRIFALTENNGIPRLNPHYFGEFNSKSFDKKMVNFIVVGGINPFNKNYTILLETIKKLISRNILNFHVFVVGNGRINIPHDIAKYITIMGRLDYDDMYSAVCNSDFILALLDSNNPDHNRYKTGTTTGSFQLSLGFNKPLVIEKTFAKYYGLDVTNAIIYNKNNLYMAMLNALKTQSYPEICKKLRMLKEDIYEESLNNLKKSLGK